MQTTLDLCSSHREEADGTHTIMLTISGMPTLEWAQRVSDWLRGLVRLHAGRLGQLQYTKKKLGTSVADIGGETK